MTDRTRHEIDLIDSSNKSKNYDKQKIKKSLKTFYELIIFCEEIQNNQQKDCWEAYDLIKNKLGIDD